MGSLRSAWRGFRDAEPGTRFEQQHESNQKSRKSRRWARPVWILLGVVVVLIGFVALPAPGPGMLVIAGGAALLARESLLVARLLDGLEVRIRRLLGRGPGRIRGKR